MNKIYLKGDPDISVEHITLVDTINIFDERSFHIVAVCKEDVPELIQVLTSIIKDIK